MTLAEVGHHRPRRPARPRLLSDPAVQHLGGPTPADAVIVSHELPSSKHKSSSLPDIAKTAAIGLWATPGPLRVVAGVVHVVRYRSTPGRVMAAQ